LASLRYHYDLFRQRHDFAAGRPRPAFVGTAGIQLLQQALVNLTGGWGAGFVSLIVMLFAFSSIVVNYLYAENNLIFLKLTPAPQSGCCVSGSY
jgi:Na+/alanine symporter